MSIVYLTLSFLTFAVLVSQLRFSFFIPVFIGLLIGIGLYAGFAPALILAFFTLLTVLLLGHLLSHGLSEMSTIFRSLGTIRSLHLLGKTGWRWLPAFILVLGIIVLVLWRNTMVQTALYDINMDNEYACKNQQQETKLICQNLASFEDDTHELASRLGDTLSNNLQRDIQAAIQHLSQSSKDLKTELPRLIFEGGDKSFNSGNALYPKSLPDAFEPPESCGLWGWITRAGECMKELVLTPVNEAYSGIRLDAQKELLNRLNTINAGIDSSADESRRIALQWVFDTNQQYQTTAHNALDLGFLKSKITTLLFYAFMLYLLLKIFLYTFFRLAFDSKHGNVALHLNPASQPFQTKKQTLTYQELGNDVSIELADTTWFATKSRKVRYAQNGKPGFPMPLRLLFRRLFSGKYYMYRFGKQFDCPVLEPYADTTTHFSKVTLKDSDCLCLNLANLVAFSETIQLKSLFSIKLALFFKHPMFFTVAQGPGEILLRIDGGQGKIVNGKDHQNTNKGYFNPVDLVAFDVNGGYELTAQHDLISVYSEGHTIRPQGSSLAIRQVHAEKGAKSFMLPLRKMLVFLLPI